MAAESGNSLEKHLETVSKYIEQEDHRSILKLCNQVLKEFSLNLTWIIIKCVSMIHTSQYVELLRFIESFSDNSDIFGSLTLYHAYGLYSCKRDQDALTIVNNFLSNPLKRKKKKNQAFAYGLNEDEIIALRLLKSQLCYRLDEFEEGYNILKKENIETCENYLTENELVTNKIALLVSNSQSQRVLNEYFTNKLDQTHSCDFVYNCALALITTKQFDNAIKFLQSSKNVCQESMKSNDEYSNEEIESELGLLDLLIGFCYILLNDYEKAWNIYDKLYKNDTINDASRKLIMMNNRLSVCPSEMKIPPKEQMEIYNKLFKQKNFGDLKKICFENENENKNDLNDYIVNSDLNGVFENEQVKAAYNKHLILLEKWNDESNENKSKENENDNNNNDETKQKGKSKKKNKNKSEKKKGKNTREAEKDRALASSLVGQMKLFHPLTEIPLWLKVTPKYNEKNYQYCCDILRTHIAANGNTVSLYSRLMYVQVLINYTKYSNAISELESIESIAHMPGTISTLIALTKKQYSNNGNEKQKNMQICKILKSNLDYYSENANNNNNSDLSFLFGLKLDYCEKLICLNQFEEAYEYCNQLLQSNAHSSNEEKNKIKAMYMLCATNCGDMNKAREMSKDIGDIKMDNSNDNDISSLTSNIPQPKMNNVKNESNLNSFDFDRRLNDLLKKKREENRRQRKVKREKIKKEIQNDPERAKKAPIDWRPKTVRRREAAQAAKGTDDKRKQKKKRKNRNKRISASEKQEESQARKGQKGKSQTDKKATKANKKEKAPGSSSMSHGASQGFVGSLDRYRIKEYNEDGGKKKVIIPEHIKARKKR